MNLMPPPQNQIKYPEELKQVKIPWDEIANHTQKDDCWVVMNNIVYDVTDFLDKHPGKPETILQRAGKDVTKSFQAMYHSQKACRQAVEYAIGIVDPKSKPQEGQIEV
ncbi:Cytochrome b5-like heme/steroid binding domain [Pseudocohnilembus persalinus]|uniref:Cytochrome b5-like heme/steroid binding domain n=1 Tax=Pseudocohnilembus persalinus TaxID=266149 RepID=A0A0V0QU66_PSEPJ|nr:Cytochrome b5-like heme/steroid binding domain [Pseudocohnilembus persalinus]|eukprot:KRX05693.1 Cytochrome b5-like heme/steroid binding domain [Pseudocohnilembus persalinus]